MQERGTADGGRSVNVRPWPRAALSSQSPMTRPRRGLSLGSRDLAPETYVSLSCVGTLQSGRNSAVESQGDICMPRAIPTTAPPGESRLVLELLE